MGLFAAMTWALLLIYFSFNMHGVKSKKPWMDILLHAMLVIACFLGAFGFSNLYNFSVGGQPISFSLFLFPLKSESYMVDTLQYDLSTFISAWMFVVAVFFIILEEKDCFLQNFSTNLQKPAIMTVDCSHWSVLGIFSVTYYINRAAYYNLDIVYELFILLLCIIAQYCLAPMKSLFENKMLKKSLL